MNPPTAPTDDGTNTDRKVWMEPMLHADPREGRRFFRPAAG
jgi:hypothetical protein